jgi:hypothetical protein
VIELIQQYRTWFLVALLVVVFAAPLLGALEWWEENKEED